MNSEYKKIKYIGFGSPLMDMIADVDQSLIDRYKKELLIDTI